MEKNINKTTENTVNIDDKVNSFGRKLGNGIGAGSDLLDVFNHVVTTRDTTPIVGVMGKAKGKKDTHALTNIRLTLGAIYKDAEIITPKGKNMIIKIKGIKADPKALKRLTKLVADGVSIRGPKWASDIKGTVTTTPTALTPEDYKKKAIALVKAGFAGTALVAAMSEVIKEKAAKELLSQKKAA